MKSESVLTSCIRKMIENDEQQRCTQMDIGGPQVDVEWEEYRVNEQLHFCNSLGTRLLHIDMCARGFSHVFT